MPTPGSRPYNRSLLIEPAGSQCKDPEVRAVNAVHHVNQHRLLGLKGTGETPAVIDSFPAPG